MGLTIHYSFESDAPNADHARRLVEQLHQVACDLPLAEVGEVVELAGDEASHERVSDDENRRWLLIQAMRLFERGETRALLKPLHVIAFTTLPGPGCEAANFGLCRYPTHTSLGERTVRTRLAGWYWQSFCKTQYASDPQLGGVENFLRCHLLLAKLLDHAQRLGILAEVTDEGGYWQSRDVAALAREVGRWNRFVAGIAGHIKDNFPGGIIAPITEYPNFEHLEAEGQNAKPDDDAPQPD